MKADDRDALLDQDVELGRGGTVHGFWVGNPPEPHFGVIGLEALREPRAGASVDIELLRT